MKISDELREWADVHCGEECTEYLGLLADRIDRETAELPKDRDGVPIRLGDTVYTPNGKMYDVIIISLTPKWTYIKCKGQDGETYVFLGGLSHDRPDSLERIADEIEASNNHALEFISESTLREWADRIRKLAEKEEE